MVQPYLLHEEQHKYPRYVNQSDMPQKSFQKPEEEIHISIEVQISEEVKLREIKIGGTKNEKKRTSVELQRVFLLDTAN